MKRAILIGVVAMAPVAGCGSDGTPARGPTTLADPVGGQPPLENPQNPTSNPQNPQANPAAPVNAAQNPPSDPAATGGARLNCPGLCDGLASPCDLACNDACDTIQATTGACAPLVNAFLACTNAITFACNGRGQIGVQAANECLDDLQAIVQCLGIDVSVRNVPPRPDDNSGDMSNNGPPPGR